MDVTIRLQIFCTILLVSVVLCTQLNAQFYGTYGRSAYFAPITFPQTPIYNNINNDNVPLMTRVNVELVQSEEIQAAAIAASKQISHGSEQFSFEMFYVSSCKKCNILFFLYHYFHSCLFYVLAL